MKNLNAKKIAIGIVALLLVVLVIVLVSSNKNKLEESNDSVVNKAENITKNYTALLTLGRTSQFLGVEELYANDKTTIDDLTAGDILNTAMRYVLKENEDYQVDTSLRLSINANGYDITAYTAIVDGESVRNAIKTLFNIDWEDQNYGLESTDNSYYTYEYDKTLDCYFQSLNDQYENIDLTSLGYTYNTVKEVKNNKNEVQVTIAIAYVYIESGHQMFFSDSNFNNKVYENDEIEESINEDYIDKLDTYTITYTINGDNYIFSSIEKN